MWNEDMEEKNKIASFRDLYAWQEGHKEVLQVYHCTKHFPKEELFALTSQMRRAAVSVTSNIAEGFSRTSIKEKAMFYTIAKGSLTELHNQLIIARDVGYLEEIEFHSLEDQLIKTHKILNGLITKTRSLKSPGRLQIPNSKF